MGATTEKRQHKTADSEIVALMPYARAIARTFSRDDEYEGEAMLALVEAARSWQHERGPFKAYAGVCIRHALVDYKRRQRAVAFTDAGVKPEGIVERRGSGIYEAIDGLPEPMKLYATLKWLDGVSYEDIAGAKGVSLAYVKQVLDEAVTLLQLEL